MTSKDYSAIIQRLANIPLFRVYNSLYLFTNSRAKGSSALPIEVLGLAQRPIWTVSAGEI